MQPPYQVIPVPPSEISWVEGEEESGACELVPPGKWELASAGASGLSVYADGPSGSGRYWRITVGLKAGGRARPHRGFCVTTSTVGWRTLRSYERTPLPWLLDLDEDGTAEFILWSSFPLSAEAPAGGHGLVAWVYALSSRESFEIDWNLSRRLASELASAYRSSGDEMRRVMTNMRRRAARALEEFASGNCDAGESRSRSIRMKKEDQ